MGSENFQISVTRWNRRYLFSIGRIYLINIGFALLIYIKCSVSMSLPEFNPSADEVHLAAASLLPFDEIKADTDLLRGKRTAESDELICKICHTYFLGCAPKVTRCAHAFCGDCLESWIQVQPTFRSWAQVAKTAGQARLVPCPVCKHPLNDKTDIHLIFSDLHEPACQRMSAMLSFLPIVCHNAPSLGGSCAWQGTYADYASHARTCVLNKSKSVIEPNTTAPPETHQVKQDDTATVFIPYETFLSGTKIRIEEKSGTGWIFATNIADGTGSWIPEWTIKKFDAWFEESLASQGKHVEKCAAIRDFEPTGDSVLGLKEGEVFTVCERGRTGWNLVITTDGTRQGWVPDNRCKVIREGSAQAALPSSAAPTVSLGTFVAKRTFDTTKKGELSLAPGDTVSVRQAHESGWTLGTVVSGGARKEGWFPDWVLERSTIDFAGGCLNCGDSKNTCTFVKRNADVYGPICSEKCWEQWTKKRATAIRR